MNEQSNWQVESLQGLEAVGIWVEAGNLGLETDAEEAFRASTYRRVEQLLRGGNVPVLPTFEETALSQSAAVLTVAASVQTRADGGDSGGGDWAALTLYTQLTQAVRLARTGQLSPAITWRVVGTALIPAAQRVERAVEGIREQVRRFVRDYNAAQPFPDEDD